jgi:hypothetical protein
MMTDSEVEAVAERLRTAIQADRQCHDTIHDLRGKLVNEFLERRGWSKCARWQSGGTARRKLAKYCKEPEHRFYLPGLDHCYSFRRGYHTERLPWFYILASHPYPGGHSPPLNDCKEYARLRGLELEVVEDFPSFYYPGATSFYLYYQNQYGV